MKKVFELVSLRGCPGHYEAALYHAESHYFHYINFLFTSKREIFKKLRNEYSCSIPRNFK